MTNALLSSKVIVTEEPPSIVSITALPTAIVGMVGITDRGPIGTPVLTTSFEQWVQTYGPATTESIEAFASAQAFYETGGQFLYTVRTAHYNVITDPNSLTADFAEVTVSSAAATAATLVGVNAAPYALTPGDSIDIAVDGGGAVQAVFNATASTLTSGNSEPFALTDSNTLLVEIDGGATQTVTFNTADFVDINNATALEVAVVLNNQLIGCSTNEVGGGVVVSSDTLGTSSRVEVTGGTDAAAFAFPAAANGTGNVANTAEVTFAEVKTVLEAAIVTLTIEETTSGSGIPNIVSNTTGVASELEITASVGVQSAVSWPSGPVNGTAGVPVPTVIFSGKYRGAYANDLSVAIKNATSGESDRFDLDVLENGFVVEPFQNLTMDSTDANYVETVLAQAGTGSLLISAADQSAPAPARPGNGTYALAGGDSGLTGLVDSDFIGSDVSDTAIRAFDIIEDLTLLIIPGRATAAVQNAMVQYAEVTRSKSIFCVLEPPEALNATGIINYVENTAGLLNTTEQAAIYWPRVKILNPNKDVFGPEDSITAPNSGLVCGVYARTDNSAPGGVYRQPAGVDRGFLRTITGLEDDPDGGDRHQVFKEAVRDLVYPKLINPIDDLGGVLNLDGTRTLKANGNFPSVAERRGVIFIEQSLKNGLQFVRHQNHTEDLRTEVEQTIEAFLINQMNVGAFRTTNPATAFFVDVSEGLNTAAVIFANQLKARVGLATNKSIDWVILPFTQDTRALEQELAQA